MKKPLKSWSSKGSIARILLLSGGIVFLSLGIWRDEVTVVFTKAIYICLECIGIG